MSMAEKRMRPRAFEHHQEHDTDKKQGGYFVPDAELGGVVFQDALLLLLVDAVAEEMVYIKPHYKSQLPDEPARDGAVEVQDG